MSATVSAPARPAGPEAPISSRTTSLSQQERRYDVQLMPSFPDISGWAEEMRRALDQLDQGLPAHCFPGFAPAMDVLERDDDLEVRLELAGVMPEDIRLSVQAGTLIVAGMKRPLACCGVGAAFHIAERTFGQFVRKVPLRRAFDASAIRATVHQGELRIIIPRMEERRGREIPITVEAQ
jgi:HSP20 family protein